jgi:phosphoribosylamine--glycine ligase
VRLESDFIDICQAIIDGNIGETKVAFSNNASACVILAAGGYPGKVKTGDVISGLEKAALHENTVIFHAGTAKNSTNDFITNGGRVLGVTATGENLEKALQKAYAAAGEISWKNLQYRRDIGL